MLLKTSDTPASAFTELDLLGSNETALSKAFGFVLAKDAAVFGRFLRLLDNDLKGGAAMHREARVEIERHRRSGRTDIELLVPGRLHVIVECKVETGKVLEQQAQYLRDFDPDCARKIMCSLTQQVGSVICTDQTASFRHLSWWDVVSALDEKAFVRKPLVKQFLRFIQKNYRMKTLKEILIQDLNTQVEIQRYADHCLYRRNPVFGIPLYFAPYFGAKAMASGLAPAEGIAFLSRVLGVITFCPNDGIPHETLIQFTDNSALREKWARGIGRETEVKTFYFLDEPVPLRKPLRKAPLNLCKGWIGGMIPQNRSVGFDEFVRQIGKQGSAFVG